MCQGASTEARTRSALNAAVEFAAAAACVANEELRVAASNLALQGLASCEGHGRSCAQFLLSALRSAAGAGSEATHDALWMLQRLAQRSDSSKAWILEARGAEALHAAVLARPTDDKLAQGVARLAYILDGLRGLADLLCRSRGSGSPGDVAVRVSVAWAAFELVSAQQGTWGRPPPEVSALLAVLMEAMAHQATPAEGQWACCSALDAMVKEEPRLGALFLERGGAPLLMRALRLAGSMGVSGEDFRRAVAYLITSLAESNAQAADLLRNEGAVPALAEVCRLGVGRDVEAALWALGALSGVGAVLEAMSQEAHSKPAVLRGGVVALCECAWSAIGDKEELQRLPLAIPMLLEGLAQEEAASHGSMARAGQGLLSECTRALGSVVATLALHVPPGRLAELDRGVEALLKRLHDTPGLRREGLEGSHERSHPGDACSWAGDDADKKQLAAEKAAEAVGRVALASQQWRDALRGCGALEALAVWIRGGGAPRRLKKYLFWAAAAIAGLPFVANELRLHVASVETVDAALCTIIDILDDDIDGEYALTGVASCADAEIPTVLGLVLEAMRAHPGIPEVQARAAHCIGLLVPLAPSPQGAGSSAAAAAAAAAVAPVTAAARRFPKRPDVARGACAALRALCGLAPAFPGAPLDHGPLQQLARALQDEGAADVADQALEAYAATLTADSLLEDAAAALALARGVQAVLPRVLESQQGTYIRVAGLKALFEVARSDLRLLASDRPAAQAVADACAQLVAQEPVGEQGSRLHEVAALLSGLCGAAPVPQGRS